MDNIVGHKASLSASLLKNKIYFVFEQERGHFASAIECYIKQYGVSDREAYDGFNKQVEDAWMDFNEEFLKPTAGPEPVLVRVLNLDRAMELLSKDEDAYTHVREVAITSIASLLIDPIPI
ncbi:Terpene synthase [Theobroma cacao]|nr:Terpene synthase [Theobroma cacao]